MLNMLAETTVTGAAPWWAELITLALGTVITAFLIPFLKQKAAEAKAKTTSDAVDAKGKLIAQLQEFLFANAANIVEREYPKIAALVKAGKITDKDTVKKYLYELGGRLRGDAIVYFGNQGIDIVKAVGDEYLDRMIEWAANAVSPFPGKESAAAFLTDHVSDWLIEEGTEWVRRKYLSDMPAGSPE